MVDIEAIKSNIEYFDYKVDAIAEAMDLDVVSTTDGQNGYPKNVGYAVVGFDSMDDIQEIARKFGMRIVMLYRHLGWGLWAVKDYNYSGDGINNYELYVGDPKYYIFTTPDAVDDLFDNIFQTLVEDTEPDELKETIAKAYANKEKVMKAVEGLTDNQFVVYTGDDNFEVVDNYVLSASYDSQEWKIGLMDKD